MSNVFNFKSWLEVRAQKTKKSPVKDLDSVVEQRLRGLSDEDGPEATTQKQLDPYRGKEEDAIFEKQLDKVRKGSSEKLTEGSLDASSSTLHKHRNPDAHTGNINKLEEQRREASDTPEKTEYKPASETPWKQQFWTEKSPDGLKLASTRKAQGSEPLPFGRITRSAWGELWEDETSTGVSTEDREDWIPGGSEFESLDSDLLSTIEDITKDVKEAPEDVPDDVLSELEDDDESPELEIMPASEVAGASTISQGAEAAGLTPMVVKIPPSQVDQFKDESGQIDKNKFIGRAVGFLTMNPEYAPPEVSSSIFSENLIDQGILMYMLPAA